jgi:hypothetical protein
VTPAGKDAVVIVRAGVIVSDRLRVALALVGLVESVTVTFTVLVPAAVGVPPIAPVAVLSVTPAGKPVADQVYGALPPVAASVTLYGEFTTPPGSVAVEIVKAGAIVSDRFLVADTCVGLVESVTVIATVLVPAAVGVPLITPFASIVSPGGRPVADHV